MIEKQVNLLASQDHYTKTHTTLVGERNQTTKLQVKNNSATTTSDTGQLSIYTKNVHFWQYLNCFSKSTSSKSKSTCSRFLLLYQHYSTIVTLLLY